MRIAFFVVSSMFSPFEGAGAGGVLCASVLSCSEVSLLIEPSGVVLPPLTFREAVKELVVVR